MAYLRKAPTLAQACNPPELIASLLAGQKQCSVLQSALVIYLFLELAPEVSSESHYGIMRQTVLEIAALLHRNYLCFSCVFLVQQKLTSLLRGCTVKAVCLAEIHAYFCIKSFFIFALSLSLSHNLTIFWSNVFF